MAETRKSDFTGDVYGDWQVSGRAPAQSKKRAWHVVNPTTGETRVVLQTDLPELGAIGVPVESPWEEGPIYTKVEDIDGNPFDIVFVGSFYTDPDNLPLDEHDEPTEPSARLTAGPGECKHGVQAPECASCGPLLGADGKASHFKYPQQFKGSVEITAGVLAANAAAHQARGEQTAGTIAVDEPCQDCEESLDELLADSDWSVGLEIETPVLLGENVPDTVTEQQLDAAVPPQDELRKAIRVLMGQVHDYRINLAIVAAELQARVEDLAGLMDSVDAVMKQAVQR